MLVKTLKGHSYGKRGRKQGDEYHIDNMKHVKLLVAVGKIKIIPEVISADVKVTAKVKKESAKKPETKKTTKTKEQPRKVSKTKASSYSRKDMKAESIKKSRSGKRT